MKIILYMAMSVNGFIAKIDDETPWSEEEWKSYSKMVAEIKNIIIGKRTYDIMKEHNEFKKIGNPLVVVLTSDKNMPPSKNTFFVNSPEAAITLLKNKGFNKTLLGGGSIFNSSFIEKKLVNEIYLDIEPIVFGKGIPLFQNINSDIDLQLIGLKKLSKNTIQLHYKVIK